MNKKFDMIREFAKKQLLLKRETRKYRLQHNHPDWKTMLSQSKHIWNQSLNKARNGPKVLIATSVGAYLAGTTMESLLAIALTLRGANAHVLLCDGILPACLACWVGWHKNQKQFAEKGPQHDLCKDCYHPAKKMFEPLGIPILNYSDYLSQKDVSEAERISSSTPFNEIQDFSHDSIRLGEQAMAGALRYYVRGDLLGEFHAEQILRRYFKAAILTSRVMYNITKSDQYDCAVFHHGIYVPQGIIGEVCRKKEIHVVNWTPGYKKQSFIFSHNDTYHRTMMSEDVKHWNRLEWDNSLEKTLSTYLNSRWYGKNDWIWFHEKPTFDFKLFAKKHNIDPAKPIIGMLSSVMWDAKLHYPANAFKDMTDWAITTIDYFSNRSELQLVIRIHPAEIRGTLPSRQKLFDEINKLRPVLPSNIIVIPPEDNISTYAVMQKCNAVIIYNTKTGIELAATGIPVIVAGEAWIKNKGFAIDITSIEKYKTVLDSLPFSEKLSTDKLLLAKQYAYHFFFRRMIPLEFTKPAHGDPPFCLSLNSIDELLPGKSPGLDIICNGIINGSEFIYPTELVTTKSREAD